MQQRRSGSRVRLAGVVAAVAALLASGLQLAGMAPASAAASSHPYSDPIWFPLRTDIELGCAGDSNAGNNSATAAGRCATDHVDYWGLNFDSVGGLDDNPPVYAAGGGIVLSVTADQPQCGGTNHNGDVVEIDHGGGVVSVYEHLATVLVTAGQPVYPSTQIATMGASGAPCQTGGEPGNAYLDFQVRNYGGTYLRTRTGLVTTTDVKTLRGCAGGQATSTLWPAGLQLAGSPAEWTDVPYGPGTSPATVLSTASAGACYPTGPVATPTQPARPTARPGNGQAVVAWPLVKGATSYLVQTQIYRKGSGWVAPCTPNTTKGCTVGYTTAKATAHTARVGELSNGRLYRVRLSVHDKAGWSLASSWVTVTPVAPAAAPSFRKLATTASSVTLYWTMYKNDLHGGTLRGFQVAVDTVRRGKAAPWRYATLKGVDAPRHYRWSARAHTPYRVKVRAITDAGRGAWMKIHSVTTP